MRFRIFRDLDNAAVTTKDTGLRNLILRLVRELRVLSTAQEKPTIVAHPHTSSGYLPDVLR